MPFRKWARTVDCYLLQCKALGSVRPILVRLALGNCRFPEALQLFVARFFQILKPCCLIPQFAHTVVGELASD